MVANEADMAAVAPADRSKEPRRQDFELKFYMKTLNVKKLEMSKTLRRRMERLFKKPKTNYPNEKARIAYDMARRRMLAELMLLRAKACVEDIGADVPWHEIASLDHDDWAKKEDEHRGWIIEELRKRIEIGFRGHSARQFNNQRRAERVLLTDTLAMEAPNGMLRGGIPEESVDWLEAPFDKNKQLETEQDLETDAADGYRAACRREAGVWEQLEIESVHHDFWFSLIDTTLCRSELEWRTWKEIPIQGSFSYDRPEKVNLPPEHPDYKGPDPLPLPVRKNPASTSRWILVGDPANPEVAWEDEVTVPEPISKEAEKKDGHNKRMQHEPTCVEIAKAAGLHELM